VKDVLVDLVTGGLASVDPHRLVVEGLHGWAPVGNRLVVLAIGKAALPMLDAALDAMEPTDALAVAPECHGRSDCLAGAHPVPDASSETAGRAVLELARSVGEDGSVLVLLSGGASALCEVPVDGVALEEIIELSGGLLRCGAPIDVINDVRAGLSAFKAGGLGGALRGAGEVRVLALSDVGASSPEVIGSGPTAARSFDPAATLEASAACGLRLPDPLAARLVRARAPERASFPVEVLADGQTMARSIVHAARELGVEARLGGPLAGEASVVAQQVIADAPPGLTVHAGETTVTVVGEAPGGRNQEGALAAARALRNTEGVFLAFTSDGIDGTTTAAGAMVDGSTWDRIRGLGLDPEAALSANEAHGVLDAVDALVRTGPTGTNVADVWAVWR
jgi:glycerate 2-kinase